MASLTISDISINGSGTILCVKASCVLPASYGGPIDWYPGFQAGKTKSLSLNGNVAFLSGSTMPDTTAGTLTWILHFQIKPSTRAIYGQAATTFTCDFGVLGDSKGNILAPHTAIAVTNRSYADSAGLLSESIVPLGGAVKVYVRYQSGSDAGTDAALVASAQTVGTPIKTLKKAIDVLANTGHGSDGSQILIVEDSIEVRGAVDPYPIFKCGGASIDRPFVIKPIKADGTTRATQRALFQLTNAIGIAAEGGGSGTPTGTKHIVCAGLNFVNQDASVTVDPTPGHVQIGKLLENLVFYEMRSELSGTGFTFVSRSTSVTMWRCGAFKAAQPVNLAHQTDCHGLFSNQVQFPYTVYECSFDLCGYYNAAFTIADAYSRSIYASNAGDDAGTIHDAAPMAYVGGWNLRSGSTAAQLRAGGAIFGTLNDKTPAGAYVSQNGGRIAYNAFCRNSDQLTQTLGVYDDTSSGPYINSADEGCHGSLVELNVVTPAIATHAVFNQRCIGFGGDGLGEEHIIRNNIAVGAGPFFQHCPIVSNVYIDGKQPQKLTVDNNLIDPTGSTRPENVFLRMIPAAGMGWLQESGNGFYGVTASKWGYVENTNTYSGSAAFLASLGGKFSGSSVSPTRVYPDNTSDLVMWYTFKGGTGGESGMYSAVNDRAYQIWSAWDDWEAAVAWLQTRWQPSNSPPRSANWLDIEGCRAGIPDWTTAGSGGPGPRNLPARLSIGIGLAVT